MEFIKKALPDQQPTEDYSFHLLQVNLHPPHLLGLPSTKVKVLQVVVGASILSVSNMKQGKTV